MILLYSLFLSPKSVSAVRLYGDETDIRRLCTFLSAPKASRGTKKAQTEKVKGVCVLFKVKDIYES